MCCDSDFVDLILLLLLLLCHELLDSVTGVLQIKNLRLLVFFLHVVIFSLPGQLKQLRQAAAAFFKAKGGNVLQKGRASAAKKK